MIEYSSRDFPKPFFFFLIYIYASFEKKSNKIALFYEV